MEVFGKRVISYVKDSNADKTMVTVFHQKETDERKLWIGNFDPSKRTPINIDDTLLYRDITVFMNEEFITFSIDDCKRSLPNVIDGQKQGQRKILYACFLRHLTTAVKVAQLSGFVSEKTNYHHGEDILALTIIKMAWAGTIWFTSSKW